MAAGWEMGFGAMGLADAPPPPEAAAYTYGLPSSDSLRIDDLPSLPSDAHLPPPTVTAADQLYYVPSEEAAELEWLSQFVDDSFSYMPYPSPFIAPSAGGGGRGHPMKPHLSSSTPNSPTSSSSTTSDLPSASPRQKPTGTRKAATGEEAAARRCSHCQSERTPQWRTGPMGPKSLCNACGVRYKSGRLVPEYRPAASPTFVLTQHSNSHRKVMELRCQKELLLGGGGSASADGGIFGDYEVC